MSNCFPVNKNDMDFGSFVMFVGPDSPDTCYPEIGTFGRVLMSDEYSAMIQWQEGSTCGDDRWWIENDYIVRVY